MSSYEIRQTDPGIIVCGPMTWVRRDSGEFEAWDVQAMVEGFTHFSVKNYGGVPTPTNPFSGWRVVSGGPFLRVGGWLNRDDAILAATPWVMDSYANQAKDMLIRYEIISAALNRTMTKFNQAIKQEDGHILALAELHNPY